MWRTVKYESVYLHDWQTVTEARTGVGDYFAFYNHQRPHSKLDKQPPAAVYFQRT